MNKSKAGFKTVGHRGWPQYFPENSSQGLLAALALGVDAIELDVQLTQDHVPVVLHDPSLLRTCGVDKSIFTIDYRDLEGIACDEAQRFSRNNPAVTLPRLDTFAQSVSETIQAHQEVFVEVKSESIEHFGIELTFERVIEAIQVMAKHVILISFHYDFLCYAAKHSDVRIGWVLTDVSDREKTQAHMLKPACLIANYKKMTFDTLWQGEWSWFVYDIVNREHAQTWCEAGVDYIETWDCAVLLNA